MYPQSFEPFTVEDIFWSILGWIVIGSLLIWIIGAELLKKLNRSNQWNEDDY
jgi:hypothetical protein